MKLRLGRGWMIIGIWKLGKLLVVRTVSVWYYNLQWWVGRHIKASALCFSRMGDALQAFRTDGPKDPLRFGAVWRWRNTIRRRRRIYRFRKLKFQRLSLKWATQWMDLQWNGNEIKINDELAALMKAVGDWCLWASDASLVLWEVCDIMLSCEHMSFMHCFFFCFFCILVFSCWHFYLVNPLKTRAGLNLQ